MGSDEAVLFDLDGTLIDSLPDIIAAVNELRAELNLEPWHSDAIRAWVGKGAEHLVRGAVSELGPERVAAGAARYIHLYKNLAQPQTRLYPGVRETLRSLHARGLKLGIVTNKATSSSEQAVARHLADIPFAIIAGPERVSARKPHPAHLLESLAFMQVSPERAVFVGDDPVDAACAKAAGVRFFGAEYGIGGVTVPAEQRLSALPVLLERLKVF